MNKVSSLIGFFALSFAATSVAEVNKGLAEASCKGDSTQSTQCILTWDMSSFPSVYYKVQKLDPRQLKWVDADDLISIEPIDSVFVDSEHLYRIKGCINRVFKGPCSTSYTTWATSHRSIDEIPSQVEIVAADGSFLEFDVSKTEDRYFQLAQFNAYLVMDITNRAVLEDLDVLGEMVPIVEPVDHPSLSHQVMHNVHSVYEGARERAKNAKNDKNRGK